MYWQKGGQIYGPNDASGWQVSHAQCPTAIVIDDKIRIFFSARDNLGESLPTYIDVEAQNPSKIIYQHKSPVLTKGALGTFDENGIIPSYLTEVDGKLYFYYAGWSRCQNVPYKNFTGLAISEDGGNSFHKFSDGPVFGMSQSDPLSATGPAIVKQDGIYKTVYSTGTGWRRVKDKLEHTYLLTYAESQDAINWKGTGEIIISAEEDGVAHCKPAIAEVNGYYYMWFSRRGSVDFRGAGDTAYRLAFARSLDFKTWQRDDSQTGITVSEDGWDSEMICYPNIVKYQDRHLMFYNGNGFGKSGFGYAELIVE